MALHLLAESAFDDLLAAWRTHWRAKNSTRATHMQLGQARIGLEDARSRMKQIRVAMYPNEDERSATLVGALCPVLDEFVHLSWTHQFGAGSRQMMCPCGELVPMPRGF
jgi:hypothetical protein